MFPQGFVFVPGTLLTFLYTDSHSAWRKEKKKSQKFTGTPSSSLSGEKQQNLESVRKVTGLEMPVLE